MTSLSLSLSSADSRLAGIVGRAVITEVKPGTAVIRPATAAAISTMTMPSPVKKPTCSRMRIRVPVLAGTPAGFAVVQYSGAKTLPRANQAPLAIASSAPNSATCLLRAAISSSPPSSAPTPGRISRYSRPVL
jgi:hypothetical protein